MLSGIPTVFGIQPWKESTSQQHKLGTKGYDNSGRIFRYAYANGALGLGKVTVAADLVTNHEDRATDTHTVGLQQITVSVGGTAVTDNQYTDGFVCVVDETGQGTSYGIKGHTTSSAGSEDITVYLKDTIRLAGHADATVTLVANPWRDVITGPGDSLLDFFTGVPILTVTDNYYCWLQTGGICSVLSDATVPVARRNVVISDGVAGSVEVQATVATETVIGVALNQTYVSGEYNPIYLTWDT